jgi:hypothetical protein
VDTPVAVFGKAILEKRVFSSWRSARARKLMALTRA